MDYNTSGLKTLTQTLPQMETETRFTNVTKPSSTVFYEDFEIDKKWLEVYKTYYIIVDSVFILPTIVGNILILVAIWRFPTLRKNTSAILIANLAVSDLLVGALLLPVDLMSLVWNLFNDSLTFCLWEQCVMFTLLVISVLNLFVLSLERFHAIQKPLAHATVFTKRRVYGMCSVIWIFVTGFGFTPVFGWHRDVDLETFVCRGSALADNVYKYIMCGLAVGSLIINTVFFFIIVRIALKATSEIKLSGVSSRHWSHQRIRRDIRHTRMMLIVSGLFIVLWGPFCALTVFPNRSNTLKFIRNWVASLGMINSSTNWIVYGLRSKKYRKAFKAILTCQCNKPVRLSETSTSMSS